MSDAPLAGSPCAKVRTHLPAPRRRSILCGGPPQRVRHPVKTSGRSRALRTTSATFATGGGQCETNPTLSCLPPLLAALLSSVGALSMGIHWSLKGKGNPARVANYRSSSGADDAHTRTLSRRPPGLLHLYNLKCAQLEPSSRKPFPVSASLLSCPTAALSATFPPRIAATKLAKTSHPPLCIYMLVQPYMRLCMFAQVSHGRRRCRSLRQLQAGGWPKSSVRRQEGGIAIRS